MKIILKEEYKFTTQMDNGKLFLYHSFMTINMAHKWFVNSLVTLEAKSTTLEEVVNLVRDDCANHPVKTFSNVSLRVIEPTSLLLELVVLAQELFQSVLTIW